jgi:uncharacterized cupin superfamily protein
VLPRAANLIDAELTQTLDEHGFRNRGERLGPMLGARQIRATVYEADPDVPTWPYHYHYGIEEWLYVVDGTPEVRDATGRRALRPGDLMCFPSGHLGAHALEGPGRFVVLDTGGAPEPSVSVYPDSDKLSVWPGQPAIRGLDGIIVSRAAGVGYWHGEGTAGVVPPERETVREPDSAPSQPRVNALEVATEPGPDEAPPGFRHRSVRLGPRLGAQRLGATVVDFDPGEGTSPYHYEIGREEWVLVLAGTPILRRPDGQAPLRPGDLVAFPSGPEGAHRLLNRSAAPVRAMFISTQTVPVNIHFPDSGKWVMWNGPESGSHRFLETGEVGYWHGER